MAGQAEVRIGIHNADFVERLLEDYLADPQSVPVEWRNYFGGLLAGHEPPRTKRFAPSFTTGSLFHTEPLLHEGNGQDPDPTCEAEYFQDRVDRLIREYRVRGHLAAKLDPLGLVRDEPEELSLASHRLSEADYDRTCSAMSLGGPAQQTLREVVERLQHTYCRYIGAQFMHIDNKRVREWLQGRMEESQNRIALSRADQLRVLTRLTDATIFEQFVRKKYVGAKTFSLEGAESLIPLLDLAIEKAARQGVVEVVVGMAHRGRLNVLANIIGKRPREIFQEFNDPDPLRHRGGGDVKYHLGYSGDWKTQAGASVHLSLCFNPSHLEYVNPVALGRMRAKQDRAGDTERRRGMVLLIHGDAAFAGEGVVQESLNMSQLAGYQVGGTLHVIVNNQIGFTASPVEGRSTTYSSDIARMLQIPIFHVNGEQPEAVAQVVDLALDFREQFQRDVIIDMFCYRRWGHNESDEPSFTQPELYKAIEHRKSVREGYVEHLLKLQEVTREDAEAIAQQEHAELEREFEEASRPGFVPESQSLGGVWQDFQGGSEPNDGAPVAAVPREELQRLLRRLNHTPADFHRHKKLQRSVEQRREMAEGKRPLDWSAAEALAIASLAVEGHRVRLSGQDSQRGTFSQRHSVLHDVVDGRGYEIFQHLADDQAPVEIINSPLSEIGVLGFDYGYSLDYPEALVLWEAQFGDFVNCAQVIIDQFIASAEDKWRRLSGLVLLLPHGFEGMGPEHSSARLERFLTMAAEDNMQIVYPTTPAQYFHCLRRQVKRPWRKPLVVITPKSLLRHPRVVSTLDELATGTFRRVLPDERRDATTTKRLLICAGKIYYELLEVREQHQRDDVALVRVEQFYPLRDESLRSALAGYDESLPLVWVQEEPRNMGAWPYWRTRFGDSVFGRRLTCVARDPSASPATGSKESHKYEQEQLLEQAFDSNPERQHGD